MNEIDSSEPRVPLLATFLDPWFKDTKFLNCSKKSLLETSVIYLINCFEYDSDTTVTASGQTSSQTRASEPHHLSALDILLGEDDSGENSRSGDHVSEIVRAYLSANVPSCESSLQWWKVSTSHYSLLIPLVQKYSVFRLLQLHQSASFVVLEL